MKQIWQEYYCEHLKRNIGDGFGCFVCPHFKRDDPTKKCVHERIIGEHTREV